MQALSKILFFNLKPRKSLLWLEILTHTSDDIFGYKSRISNKWIRKVKPQRVEYDRSGLMEEQQINGDRRICRAAELRFNK